MGYVVKTKPLQTIYNSLGIQEKGKVQQFLGRTVANNLKKYVSFLSGTQERSIHPIKGGKYVEINVSYARFQAEGKLMVAQNGSAWAKHGERKRVTSINLKYHNSDRLRGAHPFERMVADKKTSILNQVAKYAKGVSK